MPIYSDRFREAYDQHLKEQYNLEGITEKQVHAALNSFVEFIGMLNPTQIEQILQLRYKEKEAKEYTQFTVNWTHRLGAISSMCFTLASRDIPPEQDQDDFLNSMKDLTT